jgi:hypothetical protein
LALPPSLNGNRVWYLPDATGTFSVTSIPTCVKKDRIFISSGGVITPENPIYTNAVWSPTGTLNFAVAPGQFLSPPTVTANVRAGSSNPGASYTTSFSGGGTTTTNIRLFGWVYTSGGPTDAAVNLDLIVDVCGS